MDTRVTEMIQKFIQLYVILGVATFVFASESQKNKEKSTQPIEHRLNLTDQQPHHKRDPYLGFRPETNPTKAKLKVGPAAGKNVAEERDELIYKQRMDMNRVNSPNGSGPLLLPSGSQNKK
jgi:hypothetical protein